MGGLASHKKSHRTLFLWIWSLTNIAVYRSAPSHTLSTKLYNLLTTSTVDVKSSQINKKTQNKLDMNCGFLSNKNFWARFLWQTLEFCWVIFIMTDWLEFRVWVFWQPFWTRIFRLRISDFKFQKSPMSFCTFKYKYICLSNGIAFRVPRTHIDLSLCWLNVVSLSVTLAQHYNNIDSTFCV